VSIKVNGLKQFRAQMTRLQAEEAKAIDDALEKGAREIQDLAKAIAPRGDSGDLAEAIDVRENLDGYKARGVFAKMKVGGSGSSSLARHIGVFPSHAGDKGFYAAFVEFGTAPRKAGQYYTQASGRRRKAQGTHPGTPARPFLRPAFQSLKSRTVNRVKRAINKAAKQVAARGRQNP
jgi:HK97 gp10 family phage protein